MISTTSARTRPSPSSISRASSAWNSTRRARSPSGSGPRGIPAFFAKPGVGTIVAEGKEIRDFNNEAYVMEFGLVADVSLVHAWKGDTEGNLVCRRRRGTSRPNMATAGKITIAEVEHLVQPGEIDRDLVITPAYSCIASCTFGRQEAHRAAHQACWKRPESIFEERQHGWTREEMAGRAPPRSSRTALTSTSASASRRWCRTSSREGMTVALQSETACSAWGLFLTRAARTPISSTPASRPSLRLTDDQLLPPGAKSFAMIRGGHIDLAILGADAGVGNKPPRQLDDPRQDGQGHGRRDDWSPASRRSWWSVEHSAKDGPKLLHQCELPLTGPSSS